MREEKNSLLGEGADKTPFCKGVFVGVFLLAGMYLQMAAVAQGDTTVATANMVLALSKVSYSRWQFPISTAEYHNLNTRLEELSSFYQRVRDFT